MRKGNKNGQNKQKINSNMAYVKPTLSAIIFNVNGLYSPIKGQRLTDQSRKARPN